VAVWIGSEQARKNGLEGHALHPGCDFEIGNPDRRAFRGRKLLGEGVYEAHHDLLGALPIGVREEEHRSVSGHPENGVIHAKRASHEVDHLGKDQIPIRARQPDQHRCKAVVIGKVYDLVQQSPQFARVIALRLVEGHCHHDAWNIDETRSGLKRGGATAHVVGPVPIAYGLRPAPREPMQEIPQIEPEQASAGPQSDPRLAFGFQLLVVLTFCLIVLGALVRANGAGLACPDWPLCFGNLIPEIDVRVGFEWSHRLLAAGVTAIFAFLSWSAWRNSARSGYVTALLTIAAALITAQITLGALTVWLKLAPWTVTAHLITGNSFASTTFLLALAFRAKKGIHRIRAVVSSRNRIWITAIGGLLLIQLGLGGLVSSRYAGMACPEWPTCNGGVWFPTWAGGIGLHLFHRMTAYALIACLGAAALSCRRDGRLRGATALAFALGILQATIGVASVSKGIPAELTGLHTALAAALVLTVVFALQEAWSTLGERELISATH
jgi:cytochrome c oxidase assembly protein subunit 15